MSDAYDRFNGVTAGRDSDRYRAPLDKLAPPIKRWPLRLLLANAIVLAVALVGLCALVLIVGEAVNAP